MPIERTFDEGMGFGDCVQDDDQGLRPRREFIRPIAYSGRNILQRLAICVKDRLAHRINCRDDLYQVKSKEEDLGVHTEAAQSSLSLR